MHKIVNHEERKSIIAKATWNVIAGGDEVKVAPKVKILAFGATPFNFILH